MCNTDVWCNPTEQKWLIFAPFLRKFDAQLVTIKLCGQKWRDIYQCLLHICPLSLFVHITIMNNRKTCLSNMGGSTIMMGWFPEGENINTFEFIEHIERHRSNKLRNFHLNGLVVPNHCAMGVGYSWIWVFIAALWCTYLMINIIVMLCNSSWFYDVNLFASELNSSTGEVRINDIERKQTPKDKPLKMKDVVTNVDW